MEELLPKSRRITIREVSNVVGVLFGSIQRTLKDRQPEKLEFGELTNWNFRDWIFTVTMHLISLPCLDMNFRHKLWQMPLTSAPGQLCCLPPKQHKLKAPDT